MEKIGSAEWIARTVRYCRAHGLSSEDAQDSVSEVLLRYQHVRGAYPWEEEQPSKWVLWIKARDVSKELIRREARRLQLLAHHIDATPSRPSPNEDEIVSNIDAMRFVQSLPSRLRKLVILRLEGHTHSECAQQMAVSVRTVKRYACELRRQFFQYFALTSPNHDLVSGSIVEDLNSARGLPPSSKEGAIDENRQNGSGDCSDSGGSSRSAGRHNRSQS